MIFDAICVFGSVAVTVAGLIRMAFLLESILTQVFDAWFAL